MHVSLVAYLSMQRGDLPVGPGPVAKAPPAPENVDEDPQDDAPAVTEPARVRAMVQQATHRSKELDDQGRLAELASRTTQLAQISPERVEQVVRFIEAAMGLEHVDAPAPNPEAKGSFDVGSCFVYDIQRRSEQIGQSTGQVVYQWTFVDRAGRTLVNVVQQPDMTRQDFGLFDAFELARGRPDMRRLIDLVRKVAVKERE